MANVSSVIKHFPSAKEGFVTTLASTIGSGAATVPLNSVTGYSNGEVAVFIVEPGNAGAKQAFTGTVDTAGVQLTNVVWTEGTNQSHNAGSTVVDYVAATHMSMVTKGILEEHKQTGAHSDITADSIVVTGSVEASEFIVTGAGGDAGWLSGLPAPDTVTYNGNRSYDLVFNGTDLTDTVYEGMRLRTTRTVTAPIQCADLESGSSQYFNKTTPAGTTFTDDFCAGAWLKLESYVSGGMGIITRYNGTSGWILYVNTSGQINLTGYNGGAANSSQVVSYQSVPLNKWVHVAAQLDMSAFTATTTTSYVMIDGVDSPSSVARGGTNPTALVQAGDLQVGAWNGATQPFDGKISNAWYSSAKITQANMRTLIGQSITSAQCTTHSIVSAFTLNNTLNDVNTTTANNLTAQGSAVATNADSPFALGADLAANYTDGTVDFSIITNQVFSTNTTLTVQVPIGCAIPTTGGISSIVYSREKAPYGMPVDIGRWRVEMLLLSTVNTSGTVAGTTYNPGGLNIIAPVGDWKIGGHIAYAVTPNAAIPDLYIGIQSSSTAFVVGEQELTARQISQGAASSNFTHFYSDPSKYVSLATATPYYILVRNASNMSSSQVRGNMSTTVPEVFMMYAELALV